jgi:hypothetical protein
MIGAAASHTPAVAYPYYLSLNAGASEETRRVSGI